MVGHPTAIFKDLASEGGRILAPAREIMGVFRTLVSRAMLRTSQTQMEQIQAPVKRMEVEQTLQVEALTREAFKSTKVSTLGAGRLVVDKVVEAVKATGQGRTMELDQVGVVRA
jgi:hypothetical protein